MDSYLKNGDVIWGNGFINSHTILQYNESGYLNDMNEDIENSDVSGGNCFMKSHNISKAKKLSSLDSTNKRDGNVPNAYEI